MLMFKSIHTCAGLKMDRHLTCTHSLLMGMRAASQSHRQPVKLFEGRTNVIPQLYQSHRWALSFITDQEGKDWKAGGRLAVDNWYNVSLYICDIQLRWAAGKEKNTKATEDRGMLVWLFLNYTGGWRSEVWQTGELLLDCGSVWIFVVLPGERLQSCVPGDAVGVRSQKRVAVQQTLMGFPSLDFTTASDSTPSHCGSMQRLCLI